MTTITDELFAHAVAGVAPLSSAEQVRMTPQYLPPETARARRTAATTDAKLDRNPLSTLEPVLVGPYELLSFRRPGLQAGVHKALRRGQYDCPYALDLHQRTVEQARNDVYDFIDEAVRRGQRCVRIVHGRGARGAVPALLKSQVNVWLRELPAVMAFHSAQKRHGGSGALYVLLRKNEQVKQLIRDMYGEK